MVIWNSPVGFRLFQTPLPSPFFELYCTRARRNFSFLRKRFMISAEPWAAELPWFRWSSLDARQRSVAGGGVSGPASCALVNVAQAIASIAAKIGLLLVAALIGGAFFWFHRSIRCARTQYGGLPRLHKSRPARLGPATISLLAAAFWCKNTGIFAGAKEVRPMTSNCGLKMLQFSI
jgi:hypothetical protein